MADYITSGVTVKGITYKQNDAFITPGITTDAWSGAYPSGEGDAAAIEANRTLYFRYRLDDAGRVVNNPYAISNNASGVRAFVRAETFADSRNLVAFDLVGAEGTLDPVEIGYKTLGTSWRDAHAEYVGATTPTPPDRTGYTFEGWKSPRTGTTYAAGVAIPETEYRAYNAGTTPPTVTFSAQWAPVAPGKATNLTNTRQSDTRNAVTWANPASVIDETAILRSQDGGAFQTVATIAGAVTTYTDTATSANHSYAYKVQLTNAGGASVSDQSATTYNTPAAPTSVTAARESANVVGVEIVNPANTAEALVLQRSTDGVAWADLATVQGLVTYTTDNPGAGTFYYRAKNTGHGLESAWSAASAPVVTVGPPLAPTLKAPSAGAVVSTAQASIVFEWLHNPIDGSAQTAAQVQYSTDGGTTWTTKSATTAQALTIANTFAAGASVLWRVRTKGAATSYGPYSDTRAFEVKQQPTLNIQSPAGVIEDMPIQVAVGYSDGAGDMLAGLTLQVLKGGSVAFTLDMGTQTTATITPDDFMPENGATYTFRATARSTSSLQVQTDAAVLVDFVEPDRATLEIVNDRQSGTARVQASIVQGSGETRAVSMSLFRVSANGRLLLASGMSDGATIEDLYAPLNASYTYEVVTTSASGTVASATFENTLQTRRAFFLWNGKAAYGEANMNASEKTTRPERVRVRYAGRTYPVSYDTQALDTSYSLSFDTYEPGMADLFDELVTDGGRCYFKALDGAVFLADVDVSQKSLRGFTSQYRAISCTVTRIDGEVR